MAAIGEPVAMVASDAYPTSNPSFFRHSIIHPRTFGTFPQYLRDFVYKEHILTLPDAIKKITSLPAHKFGLRGRGVIGKGAYADITIFDPRNLTPGASVSDPCKRPTGIEYVIVNGQIVLEHGEFTGAFPGKVLRGRE
jgi:N-acyl-D-amino-acid deacylase